MGRGRGWEPFGNREIASCWAVIIVGHGNEDHVVNKHQKKTHKPVSETLKDPDADVINEDSDDQNEGGMYFGDIFIPPAPAPSLTIDASGPRLVITHIENVYLKSYAGKQVLGPFHESFTSIIGPNGSGKSNVIDSMLYVFGYRANKIQSKSVAVLILDSENHPND
jgi:structural maintenance of chromosome 4